VASLVVRVVELKMLALTGQQDNISLNMRQL
jgi:hypothetical protein